jgi:hypothetical protein
MCCALRAPFFFFQIQPRCQHESRVFDLTCTVDRVVAAANRLRAVVESQHGYKRQRTTQD